MLAAAMILDALVGDPDRLWSRVGHPVTWIGRLIDLLDRSWNRGANRRLKGVFALAVVLGVSLLVPIAILGLSHGWVIEILGAVIFLAHRSLVDHVLAVADGLDRRLSDGRHAVSRIVGRDPERLDEAGVSRAAIESAAENFSDGVVAPAFWFAVAGLPGIVAYKAVNTADSMIGHRTERFEKFGWASARLDDVLNWVPARLTGLLFCVAGQGRAAFDVMVRDAGQHRSPNAGWPEAAMAASLGVALAGPRDYGSYQVEDPYMNAVGTPKAGPMHIRRAISLIWRAWAVLLGCASAGFLLTLI